MKSYFSVGMTLVVFLSIASCTSPQAANTQERPQGRIGSFSSKGAPGISLKQSHGYEPISLERVTALQVVLNSEVANPDHNEIVRVFTGDELARVLPQTGLEKPLETGFLPGMSTGTVTITYKTQAGESKRREFDLINDRILEDSEFPEVTYSAPVRINSSWLEMLHSES